MQDPAALSDELSDFLTRCTQSYLLDPLRVIRDAVGEVFVGLWFAPGLHGRVRYGVETTVVTDPSIAEVLVYQLQPVEGVLRDILIMIAVWFPRYSVLQVNLSQEDSSVYLLTITLQRIIDGEVHKLIHSFTA